MSGNSISHLKGGIFAPLNCLKKLILSNNRINSINENAFVGLDSLEDIQLNGNSLTKVPSIALRSLKRLQYLNLGNNLFKQLTGDDFAHTPVQEIWIDHCSELNTVERMAFWDLPNLKVIHLEYNLNLQFIDPQAFLRVPSLQTIYLQNNRLMSLQQDMINNITFLGQQSKVLINISTNPLLCDCNIHFIYQVQVQ
jgi:leucine-rich repeat neuronal protein 3